MIGTEFLHDPIHEAPVVRLVDQMIHDAITQSASDIHIEPTPDAVRVRFRIDGLLHDQRPIDQYHMNRLIARIKILAKIDIAEKRIAQDGKFRVMHEGKEIDLRVSTFPCLHGQKIVIRILDRAAQMIDLDALGLTQKMGDSLLDLLKRPQGFLLVCGPTGSGKTTTLYAALAHLNKSEKHIITLEDPVEYSLKGIVQAQINTEVGFTFASGMRALLRQDPDVVMVGEIRDRQTAQIAHEAALTGHLVLSTLHTNDAPSVIMRLMDMGIEPFLINASLTGVLAQRLARKICSNCRVAIPIESQQQTFFKRIGFDVDHLYHGIGCNACYGRGYKGRVGVFQLLELTESIRAFILERAHLSQINREASAQGMHSLMYDGALKAAQGLITLEELMRVVTDDFKG